MAARAVDGLAVMSVTSGRVQGVVGLQRRQGDDHLRHRGDHRREPLGQRRQVRQHAGVEAVVEGGGELGLAGALVGEQQQRHHGLAGRLGWPGLDQPLPGAPVGGAGKQLVAVDQVEQRHRLAAQRMDDVAVVDDVPALAESHALGRNPAAPQRQHQAAAEKAVQPVIIQAHPQAMADQPRGHGVEHALQHEGGAARDGDHRLLEVVGAHGGQRLQRRLFELDGTAAGGVLPADGLVEEAAIGIEAVEIGAAAQQQRLGNGRLEMRVRPLDRTVLMGEAAVVAGRPHAVMRAQRFVAGGQVRRGRLVEIAERRREAVAAMLRRRAAETPQRVLQTARQGHEAFAAEHHLGVRPAGEGKAEMIQPVRERLAGDADAERGGIGEVRQALGARRMVLAKDHLPLRPVQRLPGADAPLQGAADAPGQVRHGGAASRRTA